MLQFAVCLTQIAIKWIPRQNLQVQTHQDLLDPHYLVLYQRVTMNRKVSQPYNVRPIYT